MQKAGRFIFSRKQRFLGSLLNLQLSKSTSSQTAKPVGDGRLVFNPINKAGLICFRHRASHSSSHSSPHILPSTQPQHCLQGSKPPAPEDVHQDPLLLATRLPFCTCYLHTTLLMLSLPSSTRWSKPPLSHPPRQLLNAS